MVVMGLDDPVIPSGVIFSHFTHAPPLPNSYPCYEKRKLKNCCIKRMKRHKLATAETEKVTKV